MRVRHVHPILDCTSFIMLKRQRAVVRHFIVVTLLCVLWMHFTRTVVQRRIPHISERRQLIYFVFVGESLDVFDHTKRGLDCVTAPSVFLQFARQVVVYLVCGSTSTAGPGWPAYGTGNARNSATSHTYLRGQNIDFLFFDCTCARISLKTNAACFSGFAVCAQSYEFHCLHRFRFLTP